ncbi:MAG: 16S rRNA (cytosine(1402)-N(4))-methyltransferase RsmH [Dehalococcoidia bacterium]
MPVAAMSTLHTPVMVAEVMQYLAVQPGGRYVDCTVGTGGHARVILGAAAPGGLLLSIDTDPTALQIAQQRLKEYGDSARLVEGNFGDLETICRRHSFVPVHGILFDLGLSSLQLADQDRGFSFRLDAPLDMRFSPRQPLTAADIVNTYDEETLADILWRYGEERRSRHIARRIVRERPITTAAQLAQVVERAVGRRSRRLHPATRTFQALRIAVNRELENLTSALQQAAALLGFGGRLVAISYHSLEDRIVKQLFHGLAQDCICPPEAPVCTCGHVAQYRLVARGAVRPSAAEVTANPRSRSARLRAIERVSA